MNAIWSPDDIQWDRPLRERSPQVLGGNSRPRGKLSRFLGTSKHADRSTAALNPNHPAVLEGRSIFPKSVKAADAVPRVLVSGINSAKIGSRITEGPWRGLPVFTVTLEERATCPTTCGLWRECYGNAMPYARRHKAGPDLIEALDRELHVKALQHPNGFAVRVHVLGDFYSAEYLQSWFQWMEDLPALHVWGYTAHAMDSHLGRWIDAANDEWPDRWAFRFSVARDVADRDHTVTTIWRREDKASVPEGIVCPAQQGRTDACGTCGLCWAPAANAKRIVFIGHGMNNSKP